jgi:hypothetical protein
MEAATATRGVLQRIQPHYSFLEIAPGNLRQRGFSRLALRPTDLYRTYPESENAASTSPL